MVVLCWCEGRVQRQANRISVYSIPLLCPPFRFLFPKTSPTLPLSKLLKAAHLGIKCLIVPLSSCLNVLTGNGVLDQAMFTSLSFAKWNSCQFN